MEKKILSLRNTLLQVYEFFFWVNSKYFFFCVFPILQWWGVFSGGFKCTGYKVEGWFGVVEENQVNFWTLVEEVFLLEGVISCSIGLGLMVFNIVLAIWYQWRLLLYSLVSSDAYSIQNKSLCRQSLVDNNRSIPEVYKLNMKISSRGLKIICLMMSDEWIIFWLLCNEAFWWISIFPI